MNNIEEEHEKKRQFRKYRQEIDEKSKKML